MALHKQYVKFNEIEMLLMGLEKISNNLSSIEFTMMETHNKTNQEEIANIKDAVSAMKSLILPIEHKLRNSISESDNKHNKQTN